MADNYLEALQRKTNPTRNMKGVPVEVETDIGLEKKINPQIEALFRQKLMTMDPKLVNQLKRRVANAFPDMEENKKQINKAFNMRAKENVKRNEDVEDTKRKQMKAMRDAEVKEQDKIERQREKQASKEERAQERRDNTFVDFDAIGSYINQIDSEIRELQAERDLKVQVFEVENMDYDKKGNPIGIQPKAEAELEQIKNSYDTKISSREKQREIEIQRRVNRLAFDALNKFQNREEVERRFRNAGLMKYYINYIANEKARLDR